MLSNLCVSLFQYPDYVDAYLRLAAIAKARNNVQMSIELVVISLFASIFGYSYFTGFFFWLEVAYSLWALYRSLMF